MTSITGPATPIACWAAPSLDQGGRALLAGMMSCGRCGRRLAVSYFGRTPGKPVYRCDRPQLILGVPRCLTSGGLRVEAAVEAGRRHMEMPQEQQRIVELELQQARYGALLAERQSAACDPGNRVIAPQLEKSWETAIRRAEAHQARLKAALTAEAAARTPDFTGLAKDLEAAWLPRVCHAHPPASPARLGCRRHRRVDEATREILMTIRCQAANTRSYARESRNPASTTIAPPKKRSRRCGAWRRTGRMYI